MMENFKFIRDIGWDEVFQHWHEREGSREEWQKVATEVKGYPDWQSWRKASADFIGAEGRNWKLYEILNPNEVMPKFLIGPWQNWQKNFQEKNKHTFEDLIRMCPDWVNANGKIQQIKNNFPEQNEFIGIYFKESGKFVLFEGTHRASAIAQAVAEGKPIEFKNNPIIAVTEFSEEEAELLRKKLERGTQNISNIKSQI
ncbi:MAG: hypothetical protein PHW53_02065 [Patescibacteria group bacterium]|nr:hypothetical protein [Patescibacteria group bacterium]